MSPSFNQRLGFFIMHQLSLTIKRKEKIEEKVGKLLESSIYCVESSSCSFISPAVLEMSLLLSVSPSQRRVLSLLCVLLLLLLLICGTNGRKTMDQKIKRTKGAPSRTDVKDLCKICNGLADSIAQVCETSLVW